MQTREPCAYCKLLCTLDCLEHMFYCDAVRKALGALFANLTTDHFFLVGTPKWFQLGMLCILFSLYTWRNSLRHSKTLKFTAKGLWRVAGDFAHKAKFKDWAIFRSTGSLALG